MLHIDPLADHLRAGHDRLPGAVLPGGPAIVIGVSKDSTVELYAGDRGNARAR